MTWDPNQYLRYAGERLRPAVELLARVGAEAPRRVADLGCGAGNVTRLLSGRWPGASVTGVDRSPEMLARASAEAPGIDWRQADIGTWRPDQPCDVLFSNAALHWLDGHEALFPRLAGALPPDGWLAVQMPDNWDLPSHRLAFGLAGSPAWRDRIGPRAARTRPVLAPQAYAGLLAPLVRHLDVWTTEYLHVLDGEDPVLQWTRGSLLAELLAPLAPAEAARFEADYGAALAEAYPRRPDGRTLFPVRRLFLVARR